MTITSLGVAEWTLAQLLAKAQIVIYVPLRPKQIRVSWKSYYSVSKTLTTS